MENPQTDAIQPEELEYFVRSLRSSSLHEIGNKKWISNHEIIIKLSQQAILEANSYREETVKELLIKYSKLKILVHEAFTILVWKNKILPKLLEIESNPEATFLIYTVLFHEGSAIALLEIVLFHDNGCQALEESAIDLVDYCAQAVTQLIGLVGMGYHEKSKIDVEEATVNEIERHKRDFLYKIGIRCLSILNYLVDKIGILPLNVGNRMVTVHDIPCVLSEILHLRPWQRKTNKGYEKYKDEKWVPVGSDEFLQLTKTEAQTWFCFRQLLLNPAVMKSYEINEFRHKQLSKCQGLMNDTVLDQIPPLNELKYFLCSLKISGGETKSKAFLLEEIPQIHDNIIKDAEKYGGFTKIVSEHEETFLTSNREEIFSVAKVLNEAYNTEMLADFEEKTDKNLPKQCGKCKKDAEKKCANCKSVYYCSRECQVDDWAQHKVHCIELLSAD